MKSLLLSTLLIGFAFSSLFAADEKPAPKPKRAPDPSLVQVEDVPGLPRVLLIGDSISMGYTIPVRELLKGKANVHRIPTNGSSTQSGLKNLTAWLGTSKWDVIHFNWGLHDLKYVAANSAEMVDVKAPGAHQLTPPAEYEQNLTKLAEQLKATGAKVIWCTTTPVPEGTKGRVAGDEVKYNEIAARVMAAAQVPTDDLCAHASAKLKEVQLPANVHYSGPGYKYLAEQVASEIEKALPKK